MEVVASLSQDRTAAAQCGLFTYKSVPVIFEPSCIYKNLQCTGVYISQFSKCIRHNTTVLDTNTVLVIVQSVGTFKMSPCHILHA